MSSSEGRTKAFKTPAPIMGLCIMPGCVTRGCWGQRGLEPCSAPGLGCCGQHVRVGARQQPPKVSKAPEIPPRVLIPLQTGLAPAQPACF